MLFTYLCAGMFGVVTWDFGGSVYCLFRSGDCWLLALVVLWLIYLVLLVFAWVAIVGLL